MGKYKHKHKHPRLVMKAFGPIPSADVTFGDLTVLVGPQASGKSVFLQTLKLLIDRHQIHERYAQHSMSFAGRDAHFLDVLLGRGVADGWHEGSSLQFNGRAVALQDLTRPESGKSHHERLFYIPAQRVMCLPDGVTQNFGLFSVADPYVLRSFSAAVHELTHQELFAFHDIFPLPERLNATLRRALADHLFCGAKLVLDHSDIVSRYVLHVPGLKGPLRYLKWSTGQREFTPMLLGMYWLCRDEGKRRTGTVADETIDWVVLEEPEMGLHPKGIEAVLLLVLELLRRGYRVVVSTHSPVVLNMMWALRVLRDLRAGEAHVRKLFALGARAYTRALATAALGCDMRVYGFEPGKPVRDISSLDPMADDIHESEWGGLAGFASKASETIAYAVNTTPSGQKRSRRKTDPYSDGGAE